VERLERLYAELDRVETSDPDEREMCMRLKADVRHVLDETAGGRQPELSALGERLRSTLGRVEATYPNAALVMGQVVDALAILGL